MNRYEANKLIIADLLASVEANKDARFGQILVNLGIITRTDDPEDTCSIFFEESAKTLCRINTPQIGAVIRSSR